MLVRCMHCYTPFTLSQEGIVAALDEVEAKGYKHYNAFCPRCGRPNMVAKNQLQREVPDWAPRLTAMQPVTSPAAGSAPSGGQAQGGARPASAQPKPAAKPAAAAPKPSGKKAAAPKKAAKKAAPKKAAAKKTAAKKPAAKKPAAKAKAKPKAKAKKKPAAKKKK